MPNGGDGRQGRRQEPYIKIDSEALMGPLAGPRVRTRLSTAHTRATALQLRRARGALPEANSNYPERAPWATRPGSRNEVVANKEQIDLED